MADQVIELIKPWGLSPKGALISPPANIAAELIRSGRAKVVPVDREGSQHRKNQKGNKSNQLQ